MAYLLIDNLAFAFLFYRKEIIRSSYLKKFIYHQIYSRKGGDSLLLKGNVFESGSKKKSYFVIEFIVTRDEVLLY